MFEHMGPTIEFDQLQPLGDIPKIIIVFEEVLNLKEAILYNVSIR